VKENFLQKEGGKEMKKIGLPVLAIALCLMAGTAFAIDIQEITTWTQPMGVGGGASPGFGDLLIFPLYDVRALKNPDTGEGTTFPTTQQTLIQIVNTDPTYGVIARIRFREWKRSVEVLDFDIPLSCNDVWVAEVSRNPGGGGHIFSPEDRWISADVTTVFPSSPLTGLDFSISDITDGSVAEKLARTEYGYIELIGEERVVCAINGNNWTRLTSGDRDVKNTLMGTAFLIRPEAAVSHQYNAEAYSNFAINPAGIWKSPTTRRPDLFKDVQGEGSNPGIGGFDQLEAIMSKRFVDFQYVNGSATENGTGTPMATSVVVSFPTKHFHFDHPGFTPGGVVGHVSPFTGLLETGADIFQVSPLITGGEVYVSRIFNRKEETFHPPTIPVSPPTSTSQTILPWEVNIIGLLPKDPLPDPFARGWRDNFLIATKNTAANQAFFSGWGEIDLSPELITGDIRTVRQGRFGITFNFMNNIFDEYRGLPAVGIVMTEFFSDFVFKFGNFGYFGNTVPWQFGVAWDEDPREDDED